MRIDKLIKITNSKELIMLKKIIESKKALTYSDIIQLSKRNPRVIKKSLEVFEQEGILIKIRLIKVLGKNNSKFWYDHYIINKNNEIVKFLMKEK